MFKIKDSYKLELKTPASMKLFGSIKTLIEEARNGENVWSLEVVEVVLVQCNLVDNQCQQTLIYYILLRPINPIF